MNVVIFDYGAGNIHSLAKAVALTGAAVTLQPDSRKVSGADVLILPGVGAFGLAAERLAPGLDGVRDAINAGLPTLGICLGMQLLFDKSDEGPGSGLGIFDGDVTVLKARRIPQIGWNELARVTDSAATGARLATAYFANGFVCRPTDVSVVTAWSDHENDVFPAIVRQRNVVGTQFHPEKSSAPGLRFIEHFLRESGA
jgi:glutamine amidotransferase